MSRRSVESSQLRLCVGIRDGGLDTSSLKAAGLELGRMNRPKATKNRNGRLSALMGLKKIYPINVEIFVKNYGSGSGSGSGSGEGVGGGVSGEHSGREGGGGGGGDIDATSMITCVTFFCEPGTTFVHAEDINHTDIYEQYYPPFVLKKRVIAPCEFSVKVKLRDRGVHFIKLQFDMLNYKEVPLDFRLNLSKIPREVPPSPLPSENFYVEFDLLVPYPYSLTSSSSPQHIAHFIERVALRPCRFVGYYHDAPMDGLSESEKLLYNLSWKLALESVPLTADRVALPLVLKLKSPAVKGTSGLSSVASVMTAVEAAFDELKVIRRPGIRLGINLAHYDFDQIKKLTRQYFKYYDVIEDIIAKYEDEESLYMFAEDPRDKVYRNSQDMLVQRIEGSHEFSLVGHYLGQSHDVADLIDSASCIEELVEFVCPYANRSYRYDVRTMLTTQHLEFRFEMPDIDFHPMSCVIGMLLRFASKAVMLPSPKRFAKNGQGRTLRMRKEKCFKWLIRDRNLEQYFGVDNTNELLLNDSLHSLSVTDSVLDSKSMNDFDDEGRSVASIHSKAESLLSFASNSSYMKAAASSYSAARSNSMIDPLLNSLHDSLNHSLASCCTPPKSRKPSVRSSRTKKIVSSGAGAANE